MLEHIRFISTAARMGLDAWKEGRLSPSPQDWLTHMRNLRRAMSAGVAPATPARSGTSQESIPEGLRRAALADRDCAALAAFLASGARVQVSPGNPPLVSVLLVVFNRAELTFRCIGSVLGTMTVPFELVVVDNASNDDTGRLMSRVPGARLIASTENLGFLRGCNAAAAVAQGKYLLLLNNDAELLPGTVDAALRTAEGEPGVGAVGGRLILPDGRLQEAGSIIWRDGSCVGYGRGDSPFESAYMFRRDVDFCSAAFLLTPRDLFSKLGGFDETYAPAYYEDADYCARVWKSGMRVVYDPRATVLHTEFASSPSADHVARQQLERRGLFVDRHASWLAGQEPQTPTRVLWARQRRGPGRRILVFDDCVPHPRTGFGFARALEVLRAFVRLGHAVSLYPTAVGTEAWETVYADLPDTVEVLLGAGSHNIRSFLRDRAGYYDGVLVSRSHNMQMLRQKLGPPASWSPGAFVVYDAEAITASREWGRRRLAGERLTDADLTAMIGTEVGWARGVDAVLSVSDAERTRFVSDGIDAVHVASFSLTPTPTPRPFGDRKGFLFVGSFHELSPNADSAVWFITQVLPRLRRLLGRDVPFVVVGQNAPRALRELQGNGVELHPGVPDLVPFYDAARVFVAPTRFAAGLPYKVAEAAAFGLPVVCTPLLSDQLGWQTGVEVLTADTPDGYAAACAAMHEDADRWQSQRAAALRRVALDFNACRFERAIEDALSAGERRSRERAGSPSGRPVAE